MSHTLIAPKPDVPYAAPRLSSTRERLVRASDHLWRVHDNTHRDSDGNVLGHLRMIADPLGIRYRAERLHLATGSFRLIGEFWCADEAVAALR